ncbi:phosphate transport regulator [Hydrogenophaga sp.]|uniref:phosphate transport regulator n=1 Tax=Hydrogenophaga sp. TaxID=1904254 RepID=UPI0025BBA17A|nr:phosphate transport regulator [Hydrogenophaga sp.]
MEKEKAVASLGKPTLLLPAWIKAALRANDRLKLYLSVLQSALQHAGNPAGGLHDWTHEIAHLGLTNALWIKDLVTTSYLQDEILIVPNLGQWLGALAADLSLMARPLCDLDGHRDRTLSERRDHWLRRIEEMESEEGLDPQALGDLTRGDRRGTDSFHLLVMDLHRGLNAMAVELSTEDIDGAHVWQIDDQDRPLIEAFMRGLSRTAPLKFNHPGLDTAATRNGKTLLIQNDIGTNDAHVLVIEVEALKISLTYSDLHPARFDFFKQLLERHGFSWDVFSPRTTEGLNQGKPYTVGHAELDARDLAALLQGLEAVASRIVFVIDWNRARKRLQPFVRKSVAIAVLKQAADEDVGHMAWLLAGGEKLVFEAMQSVDGEAFRIGDRLDQVLGDAAAQDFLSNLLRLASIKLREQQPAALVADEARLLLARVLQRRTFEFDLLAEHAAYCHALAQLLSELIDARLPAEEATQRAKEWERKADQVLTEARRRAERQPRWLPMVELLDRMDDIADDLEEATFVYSMIQMVPSNSLPATVASVLGRLADTTLAAIQDQIKAIEIARDMSDHSESTDSDVFLQTLWRILRAERVCDEQLRDARKEIVRTLGKHPPLFALANELAVTIERASDSLLSVGYGLRKLVFKKSGMSA